MTDDQRIKRPGIIGKPVIKKASGRREMTREGMSVDQLLAAAALDLRKIYPFLFASLYAIPRVESDEIGGVSVSPGSLYYNSQFIKQCSRPALVYFLTHGLYHILMRHHVRGFAKDPALWNEACDLYINKCLADAYGARPGEGPVAVTNDLGDTVLFEIPAGEVFDESVDIRKDTPESLYYMMSRQEEQDDENDPDESEEDGIGDKAGEESQQGEKGREAENGEGDAGEKQSDEEGGDQGDEKDRPTDKQTPDEDASSEQASDEPSASNDDGENGKGGTDAEGSEGNHSSSAQAGKESDVSEPSDQQENSSDHGEGGSQGGVPKNPDVGDIIDDAESRSQSPSSLLQNANRLYAKVETVYRQLREATFGRGTKYDPVAQAEIDELSRPRVNWRSLLRNKLIRVTTDEKSLACPDRRFVHTGLYLEGVVSDEIELQNIKVCVDTSASMSDIDVQIALFQIRDLLKTYRLSADLVYWDEEIEAVLPFSELRTFNLARDKAIGRGGTNPSCLFEAFEQANRRGHTAPAPSLVIIFTDGYFEPPDAKYRREFAENTLWILCSESSKPVEDFTPGFGTIVALSCFKS